MGLSKKKSKTTANTTQNTSMSTSPTNPEWVTRGLEGLGGRISQTFAGLDPSSLVAGPNPLQTQAAGLAASLGQIPGYDAARSTFDEMRGSQANTYDPTTGRAVTGRAALGAATTGQAATGRAASLLENLDAYMNPFTDRVVETSLMGFDRDRNLTRQQQMLDLGADETFGGSGGSILRALTEGELGLSRGQLESGLRADAFNTGAALSGQDADRRQNMTLANLAAQNQYGLANMDALNRQALTNQAAENQFGLANMEAENTFGLANMDALNTGGRFNAGQQDLAQNRRLAGAEGLVNTANAQQDQQRQNIATQASMGDVLRQIAQAQAMAPVGALGLESSLWGSLPLDLFKGQNATGTMTGNSTSTTKESGASLGDWLSYFAANAQAAAKGG